MAADPVQDNDHIHYTVSGLPNEVRLDSCLRKAFPKWPRQSVGSLITSRNVIVNGKEVWLGSWKVRNGDKLDIFNAPEELSEGPAAFDPAWVLADEGDIIAINKPAGLLSEPNHWGKGVNLWDLAQVHFGEDLTLFHRLDRDTSGVIIFTRDSAGKEINRWIDRHFQQRSALKTYIAQIAYPHDLQAEGEIRLPLAPDPRQRDRMVVVRSGGKWAKTSYVLGPVVDGKQFIDLLPETGRTHQLRVHLAAVGSPILGDRYYGDKDSASRLMLHSHALVLPEMAGMPERRYVAPLPPEFEGAIAQG